MPKKIALLLSSLLCTLKSSQLYSAVIPSKTALFGYDEHKEITPSLITPNTSPILSNVQQSRVLMGNNIKLILKSDPIRPRSTLALTVGSGYAYNNDSIQNLSHLSAHTLQLSGSTSCTKLADLIAKDLAKIKVIVDQDKTTYLLDTETRYFEEAIGAFASAIINPKFIPEDIQQAKIEIKHEHQARIKDDNIRCEWIKNEIYSPENPLHKYNPGNESELTKVTTEQIENWFANNYVGSNMAISVISPIPMENLHNTIINIFDGVKTGTANTNESQSVPSLYRMQEPGLLYVATDKKRTLDIEWELPNRNDEYRCFSISFPESILGVIISHQAKGGLSRILRECGFANSITAQVKPHSQSICGRFSITIDLTPKGVREWPSVVSETMGALESISTVPIPEYILTEHKALSLLKLQFASREDQGQTCIEESQRLLLDNIETFPINTTITDPSKWNESIDACAKRLLHKGAMLVTLACPLEEWKKAHDGLEEKAAWMLLTPQKRFPQCHWLFRTLPDLPKPDLGKDFKFPPQNPLITNSIIKTTQTVSSCVKEITSNNGNRLIFCPDSIWNQPYTCWIINIDIPTVNTCFGSASGIELINTYVEILKEATASVTYLAKQAGITISYSLASQNQLSLRVEGISSDKILELIDALMIGIKDLAVTEEIFNLAKRNRLNYLQTQCFLEPSQLALAEITSVIQDGFGIEQKIEDLTDLSFLQVTNFIEKAKNTLYLEGSYYGNIDETHVLNTWNKICQNTIRTKCVFDTSKTQKYTKCEHQTFDPITSLSSGSASIVAIDLGASNIMSTVCQKILQLHLQALVGSFIFESDAVYDAKVYDQEINNRLYLIMAIESKNNNSLVDKIISLIDTKVQDIQTSPESGFELFKQSKLIMLNQMRSPMQTVQDAVDSLQENYFNRNETLNFSKHILSLSPRVEYGEYIKFIKDHMSKETRQLFSLFVNGLPTYVDKNYLNQKEPNSCDINSLKKKLSAT